MTFIKQKGGAKNSFTINLNHVIGFTKSSRGGEFCIEFYHTSEYISHTEWIYYDKMTRDTEFDRLCKIGDVE